MFRLQQRQRRLQFERLEGRDLLATVTLNPIADNTLYESTAGDLSNGAGSHFFSGLTQQGSSADQRRGLLKFDVAAAIPAGSQIDSVTLRLNNSKTNPGTQNFALHRLLADWGEGTSDAPNQEGQGTSATGNSATWLHRVFSGTSWSSPGGDFVSTASAVTSVGGVGSYQWSSTQLAADVQSWLNTPSTQFGWLLKEVSETVPGSAKRFDSRENATASLRPALVINYSPAANQAPTLNAIANPAAILEDADQQTINLSGIGAGGSESQTLTVTAQSSNPGLIPDPAVSYTSPSATGSLSFTPVEHQSGTSIITVTVRDNGGTTNGGIDTTTRTFTVTVTPVNDAPSFVAGPNVSVPHDGGPQTFAAWASALSAGPADEAGQTLQFDVTNDSNSLFTAQPQLDASGVLTFTPAPNVGGTAQVTVVLRDNGGVANGGVDASPPQTFNIVITRPNPWHNALLEQDVNGDEDVTPLDSLLIIIFLNEFGAGEVPDNAPNGPPFYDTSGDGEVTPLDALLVITFLNSEGDPEGESQTQSAPNPAGGETVRRQSERDAVIAAWALELTDGLRPRANRHQLSLGSRVP